MSNRKDEFKSSNPNPATRFLEWDSNQGCFKFYDKEKSQNVNVKAPFRFVVLKQLHTVKGWHAKSESGIYSNEVENLSNDQMYVKSFKGGPIVHGLYKEIKERLNGGAYFKSIYIMLQDGSVANISIKGAAVAAWGDLVQKNLNRLADEWVVIKGAKEERNGSVTYTVPVFEFGGSLEEKFGVKADAAYDTLSSYMKVYLAKDLADEERSKRPVDNPIEEEPFGSEPVQVQTSNKDVQRFEKNAHVTPVNAPVNFDDNLDLPF